MEIITEKEFLEYTKIYSYYNNRWSYYSKVIEIIKRLNPSSLLELGPGPACFKLAKDSDTMDIVEGCIIQHDATKIPWPIQDKKYDLFVALQVWEHLDNKQKEAFSEVIRISKRAIFSFPYKWKNDTPMHRNIDKKKIKKWALGNIPKEEYLIGTRLICVYEF